MSHKPKLSPIDHMMKNFKRDLQKEKAMNLKKLEAKVTERERKELQEALAISKLDWERCPCGSAHCRYMQIRNMGAFNQGTGFLPAEKLRIDAAFLALQEKEEALAAGYRPFR